MNFSLSFNQDSSAQQMVFIYRSLFSSLYQFHIFQVASKLQQAKIFGGAKPVDRY